jgi:hypothetical protein
MNKNFRWAGYVYLRNSIVTLELYYGDDAYAYVDDNLADDVESLEQFKSAYGTTVADTMAGFFDGNSYLIDTVWPNE